MPTFEPYATTTYCSCGREFADDVTNRDLTYSSESSIGISSVGPNVARDPCWSTRVVCAETVAKAAIVALAMPGPGTSVRAWGIS
jgi:hypothetical protein